jgi:hypothetical protein
MSYRFIVLEAIVATVVLTSPTVAVTITFETRPDGSVIRDGGPFTCAEIDFETFRPWGVLLTPAPGDTLNILPTLGECLSPTNGLGICGLYGTLNITFVRPGSNSSTVVSSINLAMFTSTHLPWNGAINTYNTEGVLLDSWSLPATGFCREPPAYYDYYHFSAPGRIARVECIFEVTFIDDLTVTEASTPVDGSTWGKIKAFYP